MTDCEPKGLCEWKRSTRSRSSGRLFTCGRPGRATFGTALKRVDDQTIDAWADGLPRADVLHIISLLGQKNKGLSEFWYYPFRSSEESGLKPTLQEWLDQRYCRRFVVHEFPTVDRQGIPPQTLRRVADEVRGLIETGSTVLVVDSAGAERSSRVCEQVGYQKSGKSAG